MRAERYNSLKGIRAYAEIAILLMYVYENYAIDTLKDLPLLTFLNNLTFFFVLVSAFSMCCGYYENVLSGWT